MRFFLDFCGQLTLLLLLAIIFLFGFSNESKIIASPNTNFRIEITNTDPPIPTATIVFKGFAFLDGLVFLLQDGTQVAGTTTGVDGSFEITVHNLPGGSYTFSAYGIDEDGRTSTLFTMPITVVGGTISEVSGIVIAPTVELDKQIVTEGENITVSGQASPNSNVSIEILAGVDTIANVTADANGNYTYTISTSQLGLGLHQIRVRTQVAGDTSPYSQLINFFVQGKGDEIEIIEEEDNTIITFYYKTPDSEPEKVEFPKKPPVQRPNIGFPIQSEKYELIYGDIATVYIWPYLYLFTGLSGGLILIIFVVYRRKKGRDKEEYQR